MKNQFYYIFFNNIIIYMYIYIVIANIHWYQCTCYQDNFSILREPCRINDIIAITYFILMKSNA